ncbi:hypothetical protein FDB61_15890 [Clostridium botulinum]|nr:hypothetical protein [Clostridium botulinum]
MNNHFLEKQKIIKSVIEGIETIVIDPEGEYKQLVEILGGTREGNNIIFNKNESINNPIIGQPGKGTKIRIFKEKEFKKELAPSNASIVYNTVDGDNFVTMTY